MSALYVERIPSTLTAMSLSSFFSSFIPTVYADAPEEKEEKPEAQEAEQEEAEEEEEEEVEDVRT